MQIYVENDSDAELYQQLAGETLGRWLIFRAPPSMEAGSKDQKGGYWAALQEVQQHEGTEHEWLSPGLKRHCCLLDGEEAMRLGFEEYELRDEMILRSWMSDIKVPQIAAPAPRTDRVNFDSRLEDERRSKTNPRNDGILLLNCHELENLYFLYADAKDLMHDMWDEKRFIYGTELQHKDLWIILQRCILVSTFFGIKSKFNVQGEDFKVLFGALKSENSPLADLPERLLKSIQHGTRRDFIDEAVELTRKKLKWIRDNEDEIRRFSNHALRICDGKTLMIHGRINSPALKRRFRKKLMTEGFARDFQLSIMFSLTRQVHYLQDSAEVVFGRGPYAMTARSRSGF